MLQFRVSYAALAPLSVALAPCYVLMVNQARGHGQLIARSDAIVTVEGNAYFPPEALVEGCFQPPSHRTVCGWTGEAHYYNVVAGQVNANAAWFYPEPKEAAAQIKGRVAFWKAVQVSAAS